MKTTDSLIQGEVYEILNNLTDNYTKHYSTEFYDEEFTRGLLRDLEGRLAGYLIVSYSGDGLLGISIQKRNEWVIVDRKGESVVGVIRDGEWLKLEGLKETAFNGLKEVTDVQSYLELKKGRFFKEVFYDQSFSARW